ncbi:MAG: hypothetical protein R3C56_25405 [Pirellulaceae bacterium]
MAKYYASCGSQTLTISAPTAQFAAMRLIDEAMAAHVWIYDDASLSEQTRRDHLVLEALLHLGATVRVSQRGLGRNDEGEFGVPELLDEWHKLMMGLTQMTIAVGLTQRNVLPPAIDSTNSPNNPR